VNLGLMRTLMLSKTQSDILAMFEIALGSSSNPTIAGTKLATGIRDYFLLTKSDQAATTLLWNLWMILLNVVRTTPLDHPWQNAIITAVKQLRSTDTPIVNIRGCTLKWAYLPHLSKYLFENWADPTNFVEICTPVSMEVWKRWNSFAAHLLTEDFTQLTVLAYWQLASALETRPPSSQDPAVLDCKLWAATEWLIRCGGVLYKHISFKGHLDEQTIVSIPTGPLCEGLEIPVRSLERWNFWRLRLTQL
ncbi:hypothetical protein QBC44DRAFT_224933, partial [Cladorrhinum sp. PSN332]